MILEVFFDAFVSSLSFQTTIIPIFSKFWSLESLAINLFSKLIIHFWGSLGSQRPVYEPFDHKVVLQGSIFAEFIIFHLMSFYQFFTVLDQFPGVFKAKSDS